MWHTLPALVFIVLALLFFFALESGDNAPVFAPAQTAELRIAPPLEIESPHNATYLPPLAMLKGTPVLVNFFASWCTPCIAEHPVLKQLSERNELILYGIGWNDSEEKIAAFLARQGNPYTYAGVDEKGRTAIAYGITGVPESFLLDRSGRIVYHLSGPLTEDIVRTEILPRLENMHE